MTKRKRRTATDQFYYWHDRAYPMEAHLVGDSYTRRDLRNAYVAGFKAHAARRLRRSKG